jgi:hypothetical protein
VTAIRRVHLWCDHRYEPAEGEQFGKPCHADFEPTAVGFISQISIMRKEAAKAGWKHVRHSVSSRLDADLCPDHNPDRKPEENEQ